MEVLNERQKIPQTAAFGVGVLGVAFAGIIMNGVDLGQSVLWRGRALLAFFGNVDKVFFLVLFVVFGIGDHSLDAGESALELGNQVKNTANKRDFVHSDDLQETFDESLHALRVQVGLQTLVDQVQIENLF